MTNLLNTSYSVVGKYERNDTLPSLGRTKNIAEVFDVSLDDLVGYSLKASFDKRMEERLQGFELLTQEDKLHLFALLDAFLRDAKPKRAYLQ